MASKVFYIKNATAGGGGAHGSLQDGGTPPSTATTATGWTSAKIASGNYSLMLYGTERASGTFGTTAQPASAPTTNDCWRSENKLSGTFDSGTWNFTVSVIAVSAGGAQDGRIRIRAWRSPNADGSGAVEITAGAVQGSIVTNLATATAQHSTGSFSPGAITLDEEYLFLQAAWEITGAGSSNSQDVLIRTDSTNSKLTPTTFHYAIAPDDTASVTDSSSRTAAFGRMPSDTAAVADGVSKGLVYGRNAGDSASVTDSVTREILSGAISVVVNDSVSVTDGRIASTQYVRTASASATATDGISRTETSYRSAADSISVSDFIGASRTIGISVADSIAVTDSTARIATFGRLGSDSVSVTDTALRATASARAIGDVATATDSAGRAIWSVRSQGDTAAVADSVAAQLTSGQPAIERTVSDSISVTDASGRAVAYSRSAAEAANVSDGIVRSVAAARVLADTAIVAETVDASLVVFFDPSRSQTSFFELELRTTGSAAISAAPSSSFAVGAFGVTSEEV